MSENGVTRTVAIVPFGLAGLILWLVLYLYSEFVLWLGFWDGTISELDRAEAKLVIGFNWASLVMAGWLIYLGVRAFRRNIRKSLVYSVAIYLTLTAVAVAIDQYFRANLMDSAGG